MSLGAGSFQDVCRMLHTVLPGALGGTRLLLVALLGFCVSIWPLGTLRAEQQGEDGDEPGAPAAVAPEALEIFLIPDKEGRLQPMIGWTLEDFERLRALEAQLAQVQQPPAVRLEQFVLVGRAAEKHAELEATLVVAAVQDDWVRVPLRLGSLVLKTPGRYEGPGEAMVSYDEAKRQYVAWFRGRGEGPHRLTLALLAPLEISAGRVALRFVAPRAVVSELVLQVPGQVTSAEASGGVVQEVSRTEEAATLRVAGVAGQFELSWSQGGNESARVSPALEAIGRIVVQVDGRTVVSQAQLTVRSFGGELDQFQVRLPPGAALLPASNRDYTVTPVGEADESHRQTVLVRLRTKTSEPAVVRLDTQQAFTSGAADELLELGGFEVPGALRQWGQVAVQVVGAWQAEWGELRLVRALDELPADLQMTAVAAAFEYFGQPFSLPLRVVPRQTLVSVDPEYKVWVGPESLELEALLRVRVLGAHLNRLELDLAGWQLDPASVGPAGTIDLARLNVSDPSRLELPLARPVQGDLELVFRAVRQAPATAGSIEFALPRPQAQFIGPARLTIAPAANVQLRPAEAELAGLSPMVSSAYAAIDQEGQPRAYRADVAAARFVAERRVVSRRIATRVETQVECLSDRLVVQQRLHFQVDAEPLAEIVLAAPIVLADVGELALTIEGHALPLATPETREGEKTALWRVPLAEPRLGAFTLLARYVVPFAVRGQADSVPVLLPLFMPSAGTLLENKLEVESAGNMHVELADPAWAEASSAADNSGRADRWQASSAEPRDDVQLRVRRVERRSLARTLVSRAWIQTWLGTRNRQDRAVYRFVTAESLFRLRLPQGCTVLQVILDGQPLVPREGRTPEELLLALPSTQRRDQPHVLDVRYRFADRGGGPGPLTLAFPILDQDVAARRMYWQVVLPHDEFLIIEPQGLSPEYVWRWHGVYLARRPLWEQNSLENWCGAQPEPGLPASAHRYLFSSLGIPPAVRVTTISRSMGVLLAAGMVLAFGLLLLYAPRLRHPVLLLLVAVAAVAAGGLAPEAALLGIQAAVPGFGLVAVAVMLHARLSRRRSEESRRWQFAEWRRPSSVRRSELRSSGELSTQTAPAGGGLMASGGGS